MPDSNLDAWRGKLVDRLIECPPPALSRGEAERHSIFSYALMAVTHHYWNGNKYGRDLLYPLNVVTDPTRESGPAGGTYLGHNIASMAVDADGHIIDFDFNHNELFNSSVEHAESRLLRRLFSLTQVQDSWHTKVDPNDKRDYGNVLSGVTLYTTLESCAQCSGIMALAALKRVVFLQTDPGQYSVGNIMRNLTVGTGLPSPQPIPAKSFGFDIHDQLDAAYQQFRRRGDEHPMITYQDGTIVSEEARSSRTTSITSFLCTKDAHDVFAVGKQRLAAFNVDEPTFQPPGGGNQALTNREVLEEARSFVDYAIDKGQRGTPHRA